MYFDVVWLNRKDYIDGTIAELAHNAQKPTIYCFKGKAQVTKEGLCDTEDIKGKEPFIRSPLMLHTVFVIPFAEPQTLLPFGSFMQWYFAYSTASILSSFSIASKVDIASDDVYVLGRKLTVSISTTFEKGIVGHFAVNLAVYKKDWGKYISISQLGIPVYKFVGEWFDLLRITSDHIAKNIFKVLPAH